MLVPESDPDFGGVLVGGGGLNELLSDVALCDPNSLDKIVISYNQIKAKNIEDI